MHLVLRSHHMRNALAKAICWSFACDSVGIGAQPQSPKQSSDADAQRANVREIAESLKRSDLSGPETPMPQGWRPLRTVWGDPEIEGVYTNVDEWGIPFERPSEFDGRQLESITSGELTRL